MNKHIFLLLLIVGAVLGATRLFQPPVADPTSVAQAGKNIATTQAPTINSPTLSQEKDGIEISIDGIEQRGDTTVLKLTLDNHQFDLSDDAIYDNATLNGAPSQSHTFLSEASGGHHVQVEVMFSATTEGSFTIAPAKDAIFNFNNLW